MHAFLIVQKDYFKKTYLSSQFPDFPSSFVGFYYQKILSSNHHSVIFFFNISIRNKSHRERFKLLRSSNKQVMFKSRPLWTPKYWLQYWTASIRRRTWFTCVCMQSGCLSDDILVFYRDPFLCFHRNSRFEQWRQV